MKEKIIREELNNLIYGKNAHVTYIKAVDNFPPEYMNKRVEGIDHSPWELIEHIRIAQWDILDFIQNPDYKELEFPAGYWPIHKKANVQMWNESVKKFQIDFEEFKKLIDNPETDLFSPIPHAKDYTIYREILLLSNHNSYHIGQLILLRKLLGIW